jgi:DnaJ-class molecular chaperone
VRKQRYRANIATRTRSAHSTTRTEGDVLQLQLVVVDQKPRKCLLCSGRGTFLGGDECFSCKGQGEKVPYDPATSPWPEGF